MYWLFLFLSFVLASSQSCPCNSGTLSESFTTSEEVFSANVLGFLRDGTARARVAITEVFKDSSAFSVNDFVYIAYTCGTFPVRAGEEGVFFTTAPSPDKDGSFVTHLVECTKNGPVTEDEKGQLRTGIFLPAQCSDPATGRVYAEGESFTVGCNACVCVNGQTKCISRGCEPAPTEGSCITSEGKVIANGASIEDSCNVCTCNDGTFLCTEMDCGTNYCVDEDGSQRVPGEVWETSSSGCIRSWTCQNGRTHLLEDECNGSSSSNSSSKFFIIGISLASAIVVVIMATVVAVIRNRIRAREADSNSILLDDVRQDFGSDSDDAPAPMSHNFGGYSQPFANTNMGAQPFVYPTATPPVWGGQPLATTPMVLMTQTGEPVVVQVAYM
jgi:hypothetical protein